MANGFPSFNLHPEVTTVDILVYFLNWQLNTFFFLDSLTLSVVKHTMDLICIPRT